MFAQALVIPWYTDAALDAAAVGFGRSVRDVWSEEADATGTPTYANFAHGDESLEAIYGTSVPRLCGLKKKWDPKGVFGQWSAIKQREEAAVLGLASASRLVVVSLASAPAHSVAGRLSRTLSRPVHGC